MHRPLTPVQKGTRAALLLIAVRAPERSAAMRALSASLPASDPLPGVLTPPDTAEELTGPLSGSRSTG